MSWGFSDHQRYRVQYRKKGYGDQDWFAQGSFTPQREIRNLAANTTYEYRVGGACDAQGGLVYSPINEITTLADEPFYDCGLLPDIPAISNRNPLPILGVNDVFTAGDFPITVKEATGSNGVYSGWGFVVMPFLGDTRIQVGFTNASINTDYQLTAGVVETDYDPDWSNIVDVDALIKGVEDLFSEIENNIDAITDTIAEQAASGELSPEEAAAATQEVIAAQTELNEVQEKVDQKKEELKKEEAKDPKDEEKIADLKKEVAQGKDQLDQISSGINTIAEQLGVSNNEDSQVDDDTYFDGIISISSTNGQNTQLPLDSNTSVSFTELNQEVFATENPLFVATLNNSKFIISHSKTPEKTLDSIKQLLANPKSTEFLLWEHYDLQNKKLKYKVAYGAAHESKIGLKHSEYILLFNSLLERPQTDFIGSVVIRGSQGLNDLAEETKNYILPELKRNYSISRSVYEYLKLLIDLFDKCSEGQTSGIVPKCLWNQEHNKGIAYAAGIIDGAWEIAELTWSLTKVKAAWDPCTGFFASAEGIEIRKKTVDVVNNIAQLYEEDKLASTLGENINAGFEKYSKEISKLDAKGRYLQGKLVFDVASFFFGVGEVKTALKTGKITSSTAQALARIPKNVMGLINRIPGKIKLIKNNILAYAVSINTYIEIARIGGDDLVVLPGKWISVPTLVLDDLGELSLKTTADAPRTTAHIGVVQKGDEIGLGLVDDVAKAGGKYANDFFSTTGIKIIKATDDGILAGAKKWQGKGDYPGVDDWEVYKIPAGSKIYGGIPGQTEFYSTFDNLQNVNFDKIKYWESLQVKPDDILGFRPKVAEYTTKETIKVAISKSLANSQFGKGGGWQVFVDDFAKKLELVKEIPLK